MNIESVMHCEIQCTRGITLDTFRGKLLKIFVRTHRMGYSKYLVWFCYTENSMKSCFWSSNRCRCFSNNKDSKLSMAEKWSLYAAL